MSVNLDRINKIRLANFIHKNMKLITDHFNKIPKLDNSHIEAMIVLTKKFLDELKLKVKFKYKIRRIMSSKRWFKCDIIISKEEHNKWMNR